MSVYLRAALVVAVAALAACQPVVRPTTPETAVVGPAVAADVATSATPAAASAEAGTAEPAAQAGASAVGTLGTTAEGPAIPIKAISSGAEVFARINRGLQPNSCEAGSNSTRWRERYAGHRGVFARRLESILPLLDFVSTEVERAGLPTEFAFIPLVESWYQPGAIGPGGPAGMWQMIGSTARNHGIHIRAGYDGRLSPVESTRAALSYLKTLQGMFGDWQAIVMAYNAGEGRLMRAFRRADNRTASGAQRRPHGLSNITYDYVAKLQALSCLVSQPHRNGVQLPSETRFEPLAPLLMDAEVDSLDQYARLHGKDATLLRRMNPGFRNGRIVAGVPRLVLAPPGTSPQPAAGSAAPASVSEAGISVASADSVAPKPKPKLHTVRAGESLWTIARLYRLTIEQLRSANGLGSKSLVRPGQRLRLAR